MLALVQAAALGADEVVRGEVDVVGMTVIEEVGEGDEGEAVEGVDLKRAGGDERVGVKERGESGWRDVCWMLWFECGSEACREGGASEEGGEGSLSGERRTVWRLAC